MTAKSFKSLAICLLAVLVGASAMLAQNVTGTVVGTVTDSSGAVVSSAGMSVVNEATGIDFKAATSATEEYVDPSGAALLGVNISVTQVELRKQ